MARWTIYTSPVGSSSRTVNSDGCAQTLAQIEHIALATDDVERLRDFYLQLGAVSSPTSSDFATGLRSCVLDFCGIRLELFERRRGGTVGDRGSPGLLHLGFAL